MRERDERERERERERELNSNFILQGLYFRFSQRPF